MTTQAEFASEWRSLAALDDDDQVQAMADKMTALLDHPEPVLAREVENLLNVEVDSEDAIMARLTLNRLRAWLTLPAADVARLSLATEAARETLAGPSAMRSTMAVQSAIRELESAEIATLVEKAPSTRNAIAPEVLEAITTVAGRDSDDLPATEIIHKRPWWKFW